MVKETLLTPEEEQERQDKLQAEHGKNVAKILKARETALARERVQLRRGMPTVQDEMQEAVNSRMSQRDIPTTGNT